jgi:hypothetical protein
MPDHAAIHLGHQRQFGIKAPAVAEQRDDEGLTRTVAEGPGVEVRDRGIIGGGLGTDSHDAGFPAMHNGGSRGGTGEDWMMEVVVFPWRRKRSRMRSS